MTEMETRVAVLGQVVADNAAREADCRMKNDREHNEMFDRMRAQEVAIATLQTRVAFWAATGAAVAGIGVQVLFRVWQ